MTPLQCGATAGKRTPHAALKALLVLWQATMAHTVDIKIAFERYNMVPGPGCRTFRRNLMQHGGKSDSRGYSIWDTLMREDEGAIAPGTGIFGVAAVPQPGAPVLAGAGAAEGTRLHRGRVKDSAVFLDGAAHACFDATGANSTRTSASTHRFVVVEAVGTDSSGSKKARCVQQWLTFSKLKKLRNAGRSVATETCLMCI